MPGPPRGVPRLDEASACKAERFRTDAPRRNIALIKLCDGEVPRFPPPAHRRLRCIGGPHPWTARRKRSLLLMGSVAGAGAALGPTKTSRPASPHHGTSPESLGETGLRRASPRRREHRSFQDPVAIVIGRDSPPRRDQAHADGGATGGGVRAAECAQAFPAAESAGAAGGAGRCEFGAVVRRVEGSCGAAWALCGRASRMRSRGAADLAAVQGLAADRSDRSGRGAGCRSRPYASARLTYVGVPFTRWWSDPPRPVAGGATRHARLSSQPGP